MNNKTLKQFKEFLVEKCYDGNEYADGKYDKKIYEWFIKPKRKPKNQTT